MQIERRELTLRGVVQGVGFRPWVAARARDLALAGSVSNTGDGVRLTLEGEGRALRRFDELLECRPPEGTRIESRDVRRLHPRGEQGFRIAASATGRREAGARLPPDLPLCGDCLTELFDPANRRHRYPFLHCASCGPRASVLVELPYDRERTTLRSFPPCADCRAEYADADDRRHHAQTIACSECGPRLRLVEPGGASVGGDPVERTAVAIRDGAIVAVKGYGGFHLLCDATRPEVVARLRERKGRPVKPFAVLVPDLAEARALAFLTRAGELRLAGRERAVVVAPGRRAGARGLGLASEVAPRTDDLGLALPCAPVDWLLLFGPGARPGRDASRFRALVFTSANRSGEPTIHENAEAREQLAGVADLVLEHGRDVARPSDDPVFRDACRDPIPIRLSRGSAPYALRLPPPLDAGRGVLAVGGDLKCAPAVARGNDVHLAEHVGDLAAVASADAVERRLPELARLLGAKPTVVAHDLHPDHVGSQVARRLGLPRIAVQHHHAHAISCLVEHGHTGPALALVLDGAGFGPDGTIWGGELLRVELSAFERLAHLERVPLPGGDVAVREPWRMAAVWLERAFPEGPPRLPWHERRDPETLGRVLALARSSRAAPATSSCGRLFDAVGSLLDLGDVASDEGEVAVALESLAARSPGFRETAGGPQSTSGVIRVADLVRALVLEHATREEPRGIAARFHHRLADRLSDAVVRAIRATGLPTVALSGGCLQNRILRDALRERLELAGAHPLVHQRIPPNDGGLAVGQAAIAAALGRNKR